MVVVGAGGGGAGERLLFEGDKAPVIREVSSGDLTYSRVTQVHNSNAYLKFAKTVDFKCFHHTHTHTKYSRCEMLSHLYK